MRRPFAGPVTAGLTPPKPHPIAQKNGNLVGCHQFGGTVVPGPANQVHQFLIAI